MNMPRIRVDRLGRIARIDRPRQNRRLSARWRTIVPVAAGGVAGAAVMFMADPERGRRRRTAARDRSAAMVRHGGRRLARFSRRMRASLYGLVQKARHLPHRPETPANDQMLTDRVLSQAFRDLDVPRGRINVNVEEGVVVLHGVLDQPEQIRKVEEAVKKVAGVRDVASYLHLPESPAPQERPRTHADTH
jgi:hypothetical protein